MTSTEIELHSNRSGQSRAYIAGTRVRVLDVYALAEVQGQLPDQIVDAYPQLSLAQVHAALAYYFAHRDEIVRELREEQDLADRFRALTGPGPLEVRLQGKEARRDSIPS